jgi:hypothetical protein
MTLSSDSEEEHQVEPENFLQDTEPAAPIPPALQLRHDNIARNNAEFEKIFGRPFAKVINRKSRQRHTCVSDDESHDSASGLSIRSVRRQTIKLKCDKVLLSGSESDCSAVSDASYNYENLTDLQIKEQGSLISSKVGQAFIDRFKLCLLNEKDKINHNNYVLYCVFIIGVT